MKLKPVELMVLLVELVCFLAWGFVVFEKYIKK